MTTPPPPRRPGGARPNPSTHSLQAVNHPSSPPTATIQPSSRGDSRPLDGGPSPVPQLAPRIDATPSKIIEPPRPTGSPYPQLTPSLALNPRASPSPSNKTKLKLQLSSPAPPQSASVSPSPLSLGGMSYNPSPVSFSASSRPPLLNAPSSSYAERRPTPALKISMPAGPSSSALSTSSSPGYPHTGCHMDGDVDALNSALKTPTVGEDQNPTIRAGAYEDGESAYGYGRLNNGLRPEESSEYSAMTAALKKAVSKSRFDGSPNPSSRSRASSVAGSHESRRGSHTDGVEEDLSVQHLNTSFDSLGMSDRRRSSEGSEAGSEAAQPFDPSELKWVRRLGEGTGGSVDLVREERTGRIMAKKVIASTPDPALHKQILRELKFLDECSCPYIVEHYGSFLNERESEVGILMEYCEGGSLDGLISKMKKNGMRCSEHVLGRIASSVLRGLDYLHKRHIVHRDIKPSNIVLTRDGAVKLCDFGVSGETINSIAGTFTGTSYYMAPERIQGQEYTIKADVWSLGVTLHEVAHLRFPFASDDDSRLLAPIELVTHIVNADIPEMKDDPSVGRIWSEPIKDFMRQCLIRDRNLRPYPWQLLSHPFIISTDSKKVNMGKWVATLLGWPIE